MKSGIDLTSILKRNDESNEEENVEKSDTASVNRNTSSESKTNDIDSKDGAAEETELLDKLEESSKGKIKGSLILNYFKAAKRPFSLIFLVLSFLLAQILAGGSDIFLARW